MNRRTFVAACAVAIACGPDARAGEPVTLKPGDILRGRFTQERHLKGFSSPIRSEGSFVLAAGQGLIWRVSMPFATTTVITPDGLLQTADGRELTKLSASRVPFLARLFEVMNAVMAGDWTQVETVFSVRREVINGGQLVTLQPRRPEDVTATRIRSISVTVGRFAQDVEIQRVDDDFDRLKFLDQAILSVPLTSEEAALLESARS